MSGEPAYMVAVWERDWVDLIDRNHWEEAFARMDTGKCFIIKDGVYTDDRAFNAERLERKDAAENDGYRLLTCYADSATPEMVEQYENWRAARRWWAV